MVKVLGDQNSVFNEFIAEIRDKEVQKDRLRFRRNMERVGEIFGYEISKTFEYKLTEVQTSLGVAHVNLMDEEVVLATILRAGLPLHQGLLNTLDKAENAFISAYRKHESDGSFHIAVEYMSAPSIEGKIVVLSDPMLATGSSMKLAVQALLENGEPKHLHIVNLIASKEGVDYLNKHLKKDTYTIWTGAIDDELTAHAYIVPGLGDAGDLAFGSKI